MYDEVHVGQDLGGREVTIAAADIAHYAQATDSVLPQTPLAPALLFHSEVYRNLSWYLPNLIGNLHARQEWELFAPFRVGEVARSRSTVVERYRKRDRVYVVNEVLWTDAGGRWLQRSRTHQSFLATNPTAEVVVDRERERRGDRRFALPESGLERLAGRPHAVTPEMCLAFSGPHRNYHNDREMAQALGFPDIVVQGMQSVCFVADLMAERFGEGWSAGGKLDVRLVNVVWVNDVVTAGAMVREVEPEGDRRRSSLDVWCTKADGTVTVVGTASALAV